MTVAAESYEKYNGWLRLTLDISHQSYRIAIEGDSGCFPGNGVRVDVFDKATDRMVVHVASSAAVFRGQVSLVLWSVPGLEVTEPSDFVFDQVGMILTSDVSSFTDLFARRCRERTGWSAVEGQEKIFEFWQRIEASL